MLGQKPLAPLVIALLASSAPAADTFQWLPSLDAALEAAKLEKKPVFIAINMDGERANDEMVRSYYTDPALKKVAAKTAAVFASKHDHDGGTRPCPRAGVVTCADHMAIEKEMRKRFMPNQEGDVVAPQHIWVDPEGKIILSVPYKITKGEMEWCFAAALRAVDPEVSLPSSGNTHAPRRVVMGGVAASTPDLAAPPPTKNEVTEIIEALRKERRPWEMQGEILKLLRSDDKRAIDFVKTLVLARGGGRGGRGGGGGGGGEGGLAMRWKATLLHEIGRYSPEEYWEIVVPVLGDNEVLIRREASVALEQLASPKALADLTKQFGKEEDPEVQKELIRAIASCGRAGKSSRVVLQHATKARNDLLRVNAMIGAALLEDREVVLELASSGLLSEVPGVRAAAAYVIAVRREDSLKTALADAASTESDPAVKGALDAAVAVMKGGAVTELDPILRDFAKSDIPRDRL